VKTQIIQLNNNDDIVSVRDKMSWCQTGRILLVWPASGRVLNRKLDLLLSKRYATSLGSILAMVTSDHEVQILARQVGIPVFAGAAQAQEQEWVENSIIQREHHPRARLTQLANLQKSIRSQSSVWEERPAIRFLCLGISLLALLILAIFILPSAKVIISPKEELQSIKLDLIADPSATTINISSGSLPTYYQEVIVEGTDVITATGAMAIPDEPASGMIKFVNRSKVSTTLPAGSVVTTLGSDPVRFKTTSLVDTVIKPGKSVLLEAQAIRPGSSGDLPPNSLTAVEGDLGLELAVTNPEATSGGTDASVPIPSAQDLNTLSDQLKTRLLQEGLIELQSKLPLDDTLIPPSATIIQVLEETYNPAAGVPTEQVELTLRLKIKFQVVSGKMLHGLVGPILDSNTPPGYKPVMNTLVINPVSTPTMRSDGKAYWTVSANRKLRADLTTTLALESIQGASAHDAVARLTESLLLAEPPNIVLIPSWWPRLPLLAMRITLVQADAQ
jgi:hypothetical protein